MGPCSFTPSSCVCRLLELSGAKDPKALEGLVKSLNLRLQSVNRDLLTYKVGLTPWRSLGTVAFPPRVLPCVTALPLNPVQRAPSSSPLGGSWHSAKLPSVWESIAIAAAGGAVQAGRGQGADEGGAGAGGEEAAGAGRRQGGGRLREPSS